VKPIIIPHQIAVGQANPFPGFLSFQPLYQGHDVQSQHSVIITPLQYGEAAPVYMQPAMMGKKRIK